LPQRWACTITFSVNRGAEMLRAAPGSQGAKAKRLRVSQPMISDMVNGKKLPGYDLRNLIADEYGISPNEWDQRPMSTEEVIAPASSVQRVAPSISSAADLPNPMDGKSVVERARTLLAWLAVPGRTPLELSHAREIRAALTFEGRLVGAMAAKAPLHEHPDFLAWVETLVSALAPFPDAIEALERCLPAANEERSAA